MKQSKKPENLIQCTGKVLYKNYDEKKDSLFLMIGVFTPKLMPRNREILEDENIYNKDYPAFIVYGEKAKLINDKIADGAFVSIIGRMDTEEVLVPKGGRNFRKEWNPVLIADEVEETTSRIGHCNITLAGEIIRVYRNPDPGHQFYMITVRMKNENGKYERGNFFYFDRNMELEPEVGDFVYMNGVIQTKRTNDENRAKHRTLVSVISRFLIINRKDSEDMLANA